MADNPMDFNSSDLEDSVDPDPIVDRFQNAGKRNIDDILEKQVEYRIQSKKIVRNLPFGSGAPSTVRQHVTIKNMFDAFLKTIKHDPAVCPSGEIIERFIYTLTKTIKSNMSGKSVPSSTTIKTYWVHLIVYLNFQYDNLKDHYNRRQVQRIKVMLDREVKLGNLTNGKWAKKQWLGFVVVSRMVYTYLSMSLEHGTRSWDIVILKTLGVLLQTALASRNGDVARSDLYTGQEYLTWGDVQLTLEEGKKPSVQNLRAMITLRFCKGYKSLENEEDKVAFIEPLPENVSQSHVCLIKLLVVHALRQGQCSSTTLQEVLQCAAGRYDRQVHWKSPKLPVLCSINKSGIFLLSDRPASAPQISQSVKVMALMAGILSPVTAKALRNGSARDISHAGGTWKGIATQRSAFFLGHKQVSLNKGITQNYAGPAQDLSYNIRASEQFKDRLAPKPVPGPLHLPGRRISSSEVDDHLKSAGLPDLPRDPKERRKAINRVKEARKQEEAQRLVDDFENQLARKKPRIDTTPPTMARSPLQDITNPRSNELLVGQTTRFEQHLVIDPALLHPAVPGPVSSATKDQMPLDSDDSSTFEEGFGQLEVLTQDLEGLETLLSLLSIDAEPQGFEETGKLPNEPNSTMAIGESLLEREGLHLEESTGFELPDTGDAYVDFLARINVFRNTSSFNHNDPEEIAKHAPEKVRIHQVNCKGPKGDKGPEIHKCPYEECGRTYKNPESLAAHIWRKHNWKPRKCAAGCKEEDSPLFTTDTEYKKHIIEFHDDLPTPALCPLVDQCHSQELFKTRHGLRRHLHTRHAVTTDVMATFVEAKESQFVKPSETFSSKCVIHGCKSTITFTSRTGLREHLRSAHKKTSDEARELVPLSDLWKERETRPALGRRGCPMEGCKSIQTFNGPASLRNHLISGAHKMSREEADKKAAATFGKEAESRRSWKDTKTGK